MVRQSTVCVVLADLLVDLRWISFWQISFWYITSNIRANCSKMTWTIAYVTMARHQAKPTTMNFTSISHFRKQDLAPFWKSQNDLTVIHSSRLHLTCLTGILSLSPGARLLQYMWPWATTTNTVHSWWPCRRWSCWKQVSLERQYTQSASSCEPQVSIRFRTFINVQTCAKIPKRSEILHP